MRWVDHRADVIDHGRDIREALADALVVIDEQHPAEDIGGELDAERAQRVVGHGQQRGQGANPLVDVVVVLAEVGAGQITVGEADVVVLDLVEAHLGRLDSQVDVRLVESLS